MSSSRRWVLPVWYLVTFAVQFAAFPLLASGHPLAQWIWLGGVIASSGTLFLMEVAGAWLLRGDVPADQGAYLDRQWRRVLGYSVVQRASYLGQALGCWFVFGVATVFAASALGTWLRGESAGLVSGVPVVVRVVVAFVLLDGWSYLRHRLEHAGKEGGLLWRAVHRRHHDPVEMDMWTGMMVHPAEALLVFLVPCTLFSVLGMARWELLYLFTLFLSVTAPQHMNSGWLSGAIGIVFHGPEAHTRHHSRAFAERNTNFADCLTIWDRLFGTYVATGDEVFVGPFGWRDPAAANKSESSPAA